MRKGQEKGKRSILFYSNREILHNLYQTKGGITGNMNVPRGDNRDDF